MHNSKELKDKIAIVTGASEGIGRALCLALVKEGVKVVCAARNEDRLQELIKEIRSTSGTAIYVKADVTLEKDCKKLIHTTVEQYGGIDILVNNAGMTMWAEFDQMEDLSVFERLMKVNYLGSVYCTYYALEHLKECKGRLVGVSSVAGLSGVPSRTAYAASKHAMFGFFDSLRIELRETGVTVTMIAPDFVVTEIHRRALDKSGNPLGESPLQESKVMTSEECAVMMVKAIAKRDRLLVTSLRGKAARWIKLVHPSLVDTIAAKAIRNKH